MNNDKFKNAPIHDKKAIIDMMDELEPKDMIEVVELLKSKQITNKKQRMTVEWLVEQFKEYDFADVKDEENYIIKMQSFVLTEKLEQAKEMEKERMIQFAKQCLDKALDLDVRTTYSQVERYYNETYGGGEQ